MNSPRITFRRHDLQGPTRLPQSFRLEVKAVICCQHQAATKYCSQHHFDEKDLADGNVTLTLSWPPSLRGAVKVSRSRKIARSDGKTEHGAFALP